MLKSMSVRTTIAAILAGLSLSAHAIADPARPINVPAGELVVALETLSRQAAVDLVFQPEQLKSFRTEGVSGTFSPQDAIRILLKGTPLQLRTDASSGAMVIAPRAARRTSSSLSDVPSPPSGESRGERKASFWSRLRLAQSDTSSPSQRELQIEELEEIVVTGSRLRRTATAGPQPVNVYTNEDIVRSGRTSIGEFLNTLPEVDSTVASEAPGFAFSDLSAVQLRGLPVGTSLILVNGRDPGVTGAQEGRTFNLNNVPAAAVERIEIVPQGSSAIYGSDALAGVINVILKKDLQGLALDGRYGWADEWNDVSGSVAWGETWSRGSIALVGTYQERDALNSDERAISSDYDRRPFGGVDRRTTLCNRGNVYSVNAQNLPGLQSPRAGVPAGVTGRPTIGDFQTTQGQLNFCSNAQGIIAPIEQRSLMLNGSYDLAENVNLRLEALYTTYEQSPVLLGPRTFSRVRVPASNAFNPFGTDVLVDYAYTDLVSAFNREYDFQRYLIAAQGLVGAWEWEVGAWATHDEVYRQSILTNARSMNTAAINAALASSDPNVALNLFAPGSAASSDVLAGLYFDQTDTRQTRTNGVDVVLRGPLLALPAGSVDVAFGVEYLDERIAHEFHDADLASFAFEFDTDKYAFFAEGRVPLVAGPDPSHGARLALSGAVRHDEYADVGGQTTPSVGLEWRPARTLLVRASYAEAFKAPGLVALERAQTTNPAPVIDPRRGGEALTVPITQGGNPDLVPESGDAISAGIVWASDAVAGLQAELTWWSVSLTDQIVQEPSRQLFIDNEFVFPERVQRGPAENGQPGRITSVVATSINVSQLEVAGIDLDLRHRFATRFGDFTPRLRATHTYEYDIRLIETAPWDDRLDKFSDSWAHKWRTSSTLGWNYRRFSSAVTGRYVSEYRDRIALLDGSFATLGDYWIVDASFRYEFADQLSRVGLSNAYLSVGGNNLFDREPQYSNASILGYDGTSFDIRGLTLYATVGFQW